MRSKATLYDVAAAAGVSIATASKALNDLPVAAVNKIKVLRAATRLGYVVNDSARALRNSRSHTIGLIFNELTTARGLGLLDSLSARLESAGYSLICATARADAIAYDTLMARFLERRVDGLICVTPPQVLPSAQRYRAAGIPIVVLTERSAAMKAEPLVRASISEAALASLADVVKFGHRRILSIDDGSSNLSIANIDPRWVRGIDIKLLRLTDIESFDALIKSVVKGSGGPTLISAFEAQAESILAICRASNVQVPHRLSIIALTNSINERRAQALGLSSLLIRTELLGENAAVQMIDALQNRKVKKECSVELGVWTLRDSVGNAQ